MRAFEEEEKKFSQSLTRRLNQILVNINFILEQVKWMNATDKAMNGNLFQAPSPKQSQKMVSPEKHLIDADASEMSAPASFEKKALTESDGYSTPENTMHEYQFPVNSAPLFPSPEEMDVDDPRLIATPELLKKYHPIDLLQQYEKSCRRSKLKIDREIDERDYHVSHVRFHTKLKSYATRGEHQSSPFTATFIACQNMLRQLFPKHPKWLELVDYIDNMPLRPVSLSFLPSRSISKS
jgi:hypothetical protein